MPHAPGTFCWFECGSTDANSSKEFYTELFGWSAKAHPMPGDCDGEYILLQQDGEDIAGLYEMSGEMFEGVPSHWMTYVAVEDVDASAENAAKLAGKIVVPPMDVPGVGRMAFLEDPTGAHIAVFKPGEHGGMSAESPFGWSELSTGDPGAAQSFYTSLFGWNAKSEQDAPMPYTEFQVGDRSIGGMVEMNPAMAAARVPPHWMPYVMVDDCDAIASRAGSLGGQLLVAPTDIPKVGRFAVFTDPAGASLAVIQLSEDHH